MSATVSVVRRATPGRLGGLRLAGRIDGGRGVTTTGLRTYPTYALMLVVAGGGVYVDETTEIPLGPGSVVWVRPRHRHWYGVRGDGTWSECYLVFDGPLVELADRQGLLPEHPVSVVGPVARWERRFDGFRTRRPAAHPEDRDAEAADLLRLLIDLAAATRAANGRRPVGWLDTSIELLTEDVAEPVSMPDIAAAVGMTYATWRRRFRAEVGMSPLAFRQEHRLDVASDLLRTTSLSTRSIAATLGFTDERHLVRHFRARYGVTPRRFRDGAA